MQEQQSKVRVGVVGLGQLGKATARAVNKCKDMELVAAFTKRDPKKVSAPGAKSYSTQKLADFREKIDVMILCDSIHTGLQEVAPTAAQFFHTVDVHPLRGNPPTAEEVQQARRLALEELARLYQRQEEDASQGTSENENTTAGGENASLGNGPRVGNGANTDPQVGQDACLVEGYVIPAFAKLPASQPVYQTFRQYFENLDRVARQSGHYSLSAAGWEPGLFSMQRHITDGIFPAGKTYTFWGRGVSQQFSNILKCFAGVTDAVVYQVPKENALQAVLNKDFVADDSRRALHYMECYVVTEDNVDRESLREQIIHMPGWFKDYDTQVTFLTPDEMREFHTKMPHAGLVLSRGTTSQGTQHEIKIEIDMDSNVEFTAATLAACARAVARAGQKKWVGAGTMGEIPPAWYNAAPLEELRFRTSES